MMIFEGSCGAPRSSGSSDGEVQTLLYRFALACSQAFSGICSSSGNSGPENTYPGGVCATAWPAYTPMTNACAQEASALMNGWRVTILAKIPAGCVEVLGVPAPQMGGSRAQACGTANMKSDAAPVPQARRPSVRQPILSVRYSNDSFNSRQGIVRHSHHSLHGLETTFPAS